MLKCRKIAIWQKKGNLVLFPESSEKNQEHPRKYQPCRISAETGEAVCGPKCVESRCGAVV
jgi:hypothetical protein